jgi:hypothetical protein
MVTLIAVLGISQTVRSGEDRTWEVRHLCSATHAGLIADGHVPRAVRIADRLAGQIADQILVKVALQDISQLTYIAWRAFWQVERAMERNMRRA